MSTGSTTVSTGAARFSRDVALTLAARLFIAGGTFVSGVIVARWLGAASVGVLASLNVVALLAVTFGAFGLPSATTYMAASRKDKVGSVLVNAVLFGFCIGGLLTIIIIGLFHFRPTLFGDLPAPLLYVTAAVVPFQLLGSLCLAFFLGLGYIGRYNLLDMLTPAALVIMPVILLVALGGGLYQLVLANGVAVVLISLIVLASARKAVNSRMLRADAGLFRQTIGYGSRFYIAMVASTVILRADLLIVNYFRGPAEAGVYAVATQFGTLLMLVPGVIGTVLFPRATEAGTRSGELTSRVTRHVVLIMFLTCLAAVPAAFLLPVFYGGAFQSVPLQVFILLPGVFLYATESVLVQHFSSKGLPRAIPVFWLITLVVNVGLDLALVPRFGAVAAAAVSSISYAMIFVFVMVYFLMSTGIGFGKTMIVSGGELRDLVNLQTFSPTPGE